MIADERWTTVVARGEGPFVYAVRTTGVFCRPSCASRPARRENVEFFETAADAAAHGYRACLRCRPDGEDPRKDAAKRVAGACRALEAGPVPNAALAAAAGLTEAHFLREFKRHVGVSPQAYRRRAVAEAARDGLAGADTVVDAAFDAGYRSSSRFYDGVGRELGMAPSAVRARGEGERVSYAVRACALGRVLVAWTGRGVCDVGFGDEDGDLIGDLRRRLPRAEIVAADGDWVGPVVDAVDRGRIAGIPLDIQGTAFQQRVWAALRRIPSGETRSYAEIAADLGTGQRAVAGACAANRIAVLVPCHRVVRSDGGLSGYRWGPTRKQRILERERGEH